MRKFLAALLAVLMLASLMLPIAAADGAVDYTQAADGTVAEDAADLDLIVTEHLSDSKSPDVGIEFDPKKDDVNPTTLNGFQYIEIYNNGNDDINLYKLSIAVSINQPVYADEKATTAVNPWADNHLFEKKMSFKNGSIYEGVTFNDAQAGKDSSKASASLVNNECMNPNEAVLHKGQFAIIWFWNDYTDTVMDKYTKDGYASYGATGTDENGNSLFHKGFREFYNIPNETLVIAVYAGSDSDKATKDGTIRTGDSPRSTTGSRFNLNTAGYVTVYALLDEKDSVFYLDTPAYKPATGYDERVLCVWGNTGTWSRAEDRSAMFVPAHNAPDLYNRNIALYDETYKNATNYYEAGLVDGFLQLGPVMESESFVPNPGTMEDWQWAYINETKITSGKTKAEVINAFLLEQAPELPETDGRQEDEDLTPVFKPRDEYGNLGQNAADNNNNNKGGLPLGALIGIIAGGVVVVAAVAVVIIIVLKKKKAPAAAAEVVAEDAADDNAAE